MMRKLGSSMAGAVAGAIAAEARTGLAVFLAPVVAVGRAIAGSLAEPRIARTSEPETGPAQSRTLIFYGPVRPAPTATLHVERNTAAGTSVHQ